ncbi:hypothetical protein BN1326_150075 [Staphylococcus argenteus]|uniref:Uncharacterized protein n=1 Tax=Staphylococcus argenteus TaxID=985002 RepID=A0A7U7PWV9_9STAP|nr:hypothetical protein BN1326_150075 [Staphylococcus argenteus]CRI17729.1 hypothetical protein BN1326_150075 [Staphylococcus argenteus]
MGRAFLLIKATLYKEQKFRLEKPYCIITKMVVVIKYEVLCNFI